MKAEDTIIEGGVKQTLKINWSNTITGHLLGWQPTLEPNAQDKFDEFIRQIRLEQAEISFKAGIREVVEYIVDNRMIPLCDYSVTGTIRQDEEHREDCRRCSWQAKLKEWGIE